MKKSFIFAVISVCATFVACALILVKPNLLLRRASGISVKGYAVERVVSDTASIDFSVGTSAKIAQGATRAEVYKKAVSNQKEALEILKTCGIDASAVNAGTVCVEDICKNNQNGYPTSEVEGYRAYASISVVLKDVQLAKTVTEKLSELAGRNVEITAMLVQYYYSKIESLKLDLIERATQNARERAQMLTRGSGSNLGGIMSASQGVFQITRPLSTDTSSWGIYDTSTVEKDVKCIVNVEFSIK